MNKSLTIILLCLVLASCNQYSSKLRHALKLSGDNRAELQRVLDHYSQDAADSLKLKAAIFLIENMPGHYSIAGSEVEEYVSRVDSICPNLEYYLYPSIYLQPYYTNKLKQIPEQKYDIENISADFLIKNIDFKFALLDATPWGKEIEFGLFCETILPYRCDVEPLKDIPADSLDAFVKILRNATPKLNNIELNVQTYSGVLFEHVFQDRKSFMQAVPFYMTPNLLDCVLNAISIQCRNLWLCIPSFIDITPEWATKDNRHYWNCISDFDNRRYTSNEIPTEIKAKVYRKTFSQNEYIEGFFDTRFLKDVSADYLNCKDIMIKVDHTGSAETVYLCVFNEHEWRPVAWTKSQGEKAKFENIAQNVLYMSVIYDNNVQICASAPFYLDMSGNICTVKPDTCKLHKLNLTRKFPIDERQINYIGNLINVTFESSNNSQFERYELIDSITAIKQPPHYECKVENSNKFRYWRIRKPSLLSVAELKFYDENGNSIIGKPIYESHNHTGMVTKAFDDDVLTYHHMYLWVGVDFGKPITISQIDITPQTDGNYIYPGDGYELCYHNGKEWVAHETKVANDYFIEFDDVPIGALYWLRNLTEGKEERPFTFQNGQIRFW